MWWYGFSLCFIGLYGCEYSPCLVIGCVFSKILTRTVLGLILGVIFGRVFGLLVLD